MCICLVRDSDRLKRQCVHTEFCVVLVGGCCMLSVCVKVDVCYGAHMGAGGRAALSVWLCEKMVDSVSVLSLYINQLCHRIFDADGNGPCINSLSTGVAAIPSRLSST